MLCQLSYAPNSRTAHGAELTTNTFGAGGGKRDRTADLLVANQTLSQLSYAPWKS
jgi:hypothetical protein